MKAPEMQGNILLKIKKLERLPVKEMGKKIVNNGIIERMDREV